MEVSGNMSDLIERQTAIDAIHDEFDDVRVWGESGAEAANKIEDVLWRVPSGQQWIPCDERLPEEDGEYLIYNGYGKIHIDHYSGCLGWLQHRAIAWMPLPEPPKEVVI